MNFKYSTLTSLELDKEDINYSCSLHMFPDTASSIREILERRWSPL